MRQVIRDRLQHLNEESYRAWILNSFIFSLYLRVPLSSHWVRCARRVRAARVTQTDLRWPRRGGFGRGLALPRWLAGVTWFTRVVGAYAARRPAACSSSFQHPRQPPRRV